MKFWHEVLDTIASVAAALVPSALGALIYQLHATALTWGQRVTAYLSGIVVSYYVRIGLTGWFGMNDFVGQAVAFVIGMIACKSTPRFIDASADAIAALPARILEWLPTRKDHHK